MNLMKYSVLIPIFFLSFPASADEPELRPLPKTVEGFTFGQTEAGARKACKKISNVNEFDFQQMAIREIHNK